MTAAGAPRAGERRQADALARLEARHADTRVATASPDGRPSLVPLSFGWRDGEVVLATEARSPTARNLEANGAARLAFGGTRDVVMIDARLAASGSVSDASVAPLLAAFGAQADWDPTGAEGYVVLSLRPERAQAWRDDGEIRGRTIMWDGRWLYGPPASPRHAGGVTLAQPVTVARSPAVRSSARSASSTKRCTSSPAGTTASMPPRP